MLQGSCFIFFGPFLSILLEAERFLIRSSLLFPDVLLNVSSYHCSIGTRCRRKWNRLRAWPRGYQKNIKIRSWKRFPSIFHEIVSHFSAHFSSSHLEAERFLMRSSLLFPNVLSKREQLPVLFWHPEHRKESWSDSGRGRGVIT